MWVVKRIVCWLKGHDWHHRYHGIEVFIICRRCHMFGFPAATPKGGAK